MTSFVPSPPIYLSRGDDYCQFAVVGPFLNAGQNKDWAMLACNSKELFDGELIKAYRTRVWLSSEAGWRYCIPVEIVLHEGIKSLRIMVFGHKKISVSPESIPKFCSEEGIPWPAIFGSWLRDDFGLEKAGNFVLEFEPHRIPTLSDIAVTKWSFRSSFRKGRLNSWPPRISFPMSSSGISQRLRWSMRPG